MFIELLQEIMESEMFLTVKTSNSFSDILAMDYTDMSVMVVRIKDRLTPKEKPKEEEPPVMDYNAFYGVNNE